MSAHSERDRTRTNSRKRFWIWAVTFVVAMSLVGAGWGCLSERALGQEPSPAVASVPRPAAAELQRCCSADVRRWARRAAKRFRAGKIRKDHGFRPGAVFRAPRKARRVWVTKIHRYIRSHPGHLRTLRPRVVRGSACYPSERCYASGLYRDAVRRSTCVTGSYPAAASRACERAPWRNGPGLTKKQIQNGGTVVLCGTGVAMGVATAGPTRGASLALVAFVGAFSCGWSFWKAIDPG